LFKTPKYSSYVKEDFKVFNVLDFIALVTAHIPPKNKQYIRRYGLYASRTRGIWERFKHLTKLAPAGFKEKHNLEQDKETDNPVSETQESSASRKQQAYT